MRSSFGRYENFPEGGLAARKGLPISLRPDGIDSLIASVAVLPAGTDLQDIADAVSVSISEEEARPMEYPGRYLPSALPEGCRYGKAAHYRTMMKDITE